MSLIGNLLWIIFGGFIIFLEYLLASIVLLCTIIGIPFALQTLKLAKLALFPFGSKIQDADSSSGGLLSLLFNIIWIFIGGIWIALTHVLVGIVLCITIIGIPFGVQHFKLAGLALVPFGKEVNFD